MTYTANFTKIDSGYMGQILEWPEVVTEGHNLDDCRASLKDALEQMLITYKEIGKEIPLRSNLIESFELEPFDVS